MADWTDLESLIRDQGALSYPMSSSNLLHFRKTEEYLTTTAQESWILLRSEIMICFRNPSLEACSYCMFLSRRFHRPMNWSGIQIPIVTSVTNCINHKHELMSTRCGHVKDKWGGIVLSLLKRAHAYEDWNWPISREKYLNIDWSVRVPLHWLIMGVGGS